MKHQTGIHKNENKKYKKNEIWLYIARLLHGRGHYTISNEEKIKEQVVVVR